MTNLKKLLIQAKSSVLIRTYLRLFPTLIGLSVISTFLIYQPALAQDLTDRFLSKLGLRTQTITTTKIDIITPINDYRTENSRTALQNSSELDDVAKLLTLTIADNPSSDQEIDLKKLASLADYPYTTIAYLAAINPVPLVTSPTNLWIEDAKSDILDQEFTQIGSHQLNTRIDNQEQLITVIVMAKPQAANTSTRTTIRKATTQPYYTGVELWAQLQKYRVEHGVPEFKQDNTLCTIASIRVNQLLELGKLDNHAGFSPLVDQFRNENRITHTNVAENILSGYPTASEAVAGWDSSLGHQALMRDGAYVFACAAANYGFAVLVAAF